MKGKSGILILTAIIAILCLYYLSFTFVARGVQSDARSYATNSKGNVDFAKKQAYLDSVWSEVVYDVGVKKYTYEQVKKSELSLGLDLQGGMHVVLEVSPRDIIKAMIGKRAKNPQIMAAIKKASEKQKDSQSSFAKLFVESFRDLNGTANLAHYFTNINYKNINNNSSDEDIIKLIDTEVDSAADRSYQVLRARIDKFGVANPNIQRLSASGRIQVELPGVDNPERARKLLTGAAKLEFYHAYDLQDIQAELGQFVQYVDAQESAGTKGNKNPFEDQKEDGKKDGQSDNPFATEGDTATAVSDSLNTDSTASIKDTAMANTDEIKADSTNAGASSKLFVGAPHALYVALKDTAKVNKYLQSKEAKAIFSNKIVPMWDVKVSERKGESPYNGLLALNFIAKKGVDGKALLAGEVVSDASSTRDQYGKPAVSMTMNVVGAQKWSKITEKYTNKRIAIVLDNYIYSAPNIMGKISGGSSSITGDFTVEESKDLANILKSGKLPAPLRIVEEAVVGPSLGAESISQGVWSIAAGIGLVILFMGLYYNSGGWVANLALILNVFFIFGVLVPFGAVLTLPGIAGIVLTIGMAVDANVLIFERIREELRNELPLKKAISLGYGKALSSIIDANVTTFLIGLILFVLGTGAVKGFATVLMIGIGCSLFSAVVFSRVIVEFLAKDVAKPRVKFSSALTKAVKGFFEDNNFQFIKNRKKAYIFSGLIIALGIASVVIQGGMNLGVDFSGGRSYVVQFDKAVPVNEVRAGVVKQFDNKGTEVKTFGSSNKVKITTSYLIDDDSKAADDKVQKALLTGLKSFEGEHPKVLSTMKIGATMADDIRNTSLVAGLMAVLAIFIYILFRFRKIQYSFGAIVALVHDVAMVLSLYSIANLIGFKLEVDQVFIAAILTVIGYSINDTVVVFDRIREFSNRFVNQDLSVTLNTALNQTLSRTIITAVTTFLVVIVLLIFGGEVLRGFSFALFIGVVFGTYSSLFIASPIVLDFAKDKLEKAQREAEEKRRLQEEEMKDVDPEV